MSSRDRSDASESRARLREDTSSVSHFASCGDETWIPRPDADPFYPRISSADATRATSANTAAPTNKLPSDA